ncbi:hypothetical protein HOY82DRAFT_27517 [Tuber indicum]|nr:hypothetical protein HOY82DRAFT_27517 [Tuber indicum]
MASEGMIGANSCLLLPPSPSFFFVFSALVTEWVVWEMTVSRYKKIVWFAFQFFLLWVLGRVCCVRAAVVPWGDEMPEACAYVIGAKELLLVSTFLSRSTMKKKNRGRMVICLLTSLLAHGLATRWVARPTGGLERTKTYIFHGFLPQQPIRPPFLPAVTVGTRGPIHKRRHKLPCREG